MASVTGSRPATSPDPRALTRLLDGRYHEVRERSRELLSSERYARPAVPPPTAEYRELVFGWLRELAATGETSLGFPVEHGGRGDVGASVAAFETMAHHDLSLLVKVGVQFGLFGGAVLHLGTHDHHEQYLRAIASTELPGCFAMTETGHGSDVQSLRTTATYDADAREFVIDTPDDDARKDYIGNAACHGRMAVVFAQLIVAGERHGVHALLVPLRGDDGEPLPGVRIEDCGHKMGLNGVDNGRIWFDGVRVPRTALLNRYAEVTPDGRYESPIENPNRRFFTMVGTLIQGRVCISGAGVSAAKSALTIAVRYALRRRQFGPPAGSSELVLLDYGEHQRRLLPRVARTYAMHFAQERLATQFHEAFSATDYPERERRQLESLAAGLKALSTWHATDTIQACREACGGAGYLTENLFTALKADTDVFTTFEGDNTLLLQLVAKGLLTDYQQEFGELDPLGTVSYVARTAFDTAVERSRARDLIAAVVDFVPGVDDPREFPDREYQGELLAWREEHKLSTLARRLKGGIDQGFEAFDVFSTTQHHVVAAAKAHIERIAHDAFADAVEACEDPVIAPVLARLCDLYALTTIEDDRAFFLEHSRLSAVRTKAVTRAVNDLCSELRAHAAALVDGFGIPDELVAAPIAPRG